MKSDIVIIELLKTNDGKVVHEPFILVLLLHVRFEFRPLIWKCPTDLLQSRAWNLMKQRPTFKISTDFVVLLREIR